VCGETPVVASLSPLRSVVGVQLPRKDGFFTSAERIALDSGCSGRDLNSEFPSFAAPAPAFPDCRIISLPSVLKKRPFVAWFAYERGRSTITF